MNHMIKDWFIVCLVLLVFSCQAKQGMSSVGQTDTVQIQMKAFPFPGTIKYFV